MLDKIQQETLYHDQLQTLLNAGVAHIRKQGHPALNSSGTCMYRTKVIDEDYAPSSCFIGGCIADDHYDTESEDESVTQEGPLRMLADSGFPITFPTAPEVQGSGRPVDRRLNKDLLRSMQSSLHDNVAREAGLSNFTRELVVSEGLYDESTGRTYALTRDEDPVEFDARWMAQFELELNTFGIRHGFTIPPIESTPESTGDTK